MNKKTNAKNVFKLSMINFNHLNKLLIRFFMLSFIASGLLSCSGSAKKNNDAHQPIFVEQNLKDKIEIVCFVYHRFGDDRYPSTSVKLNEFKAHLRWLKDQDYQVVSFGEALDIVRQGKVITNKLACITVDDGYKTFMSGAMPLLRSFNCKATLFVNTETVGGGDYLSWEELKKLQKEGIEIGNHSHKHPYFLNAENRIIQFKEDVSLAEKLFKENMDFKPDVFAYPYGEFDQSMADYLKENGYKGAGAQNSGVMHELSDLYAVPRFPMASQYAKLEQFVEKAKMKPLRVQYSKPRTYAIGEDNPPILSLHIADSMVDVDNMQVFVQFGGGSIEKQADSESDITVKANTPLQNRRTLYTLTAPSIDRKSWYWFSHLWVRPEIPE